MTLELTIEEESKLKYIIDRWCWSEEGPSAYDCSIMKELSLQELIKYLIDNNIY